MAKILKFTDRPRHQLDMATIIVAPMTTMSHNLGSAKEPKDVFSFCIDANGDSRFDVQLDREELDRLIAFAQRQPRLDQRDERNRSAI